MYEPSVTLEPSMYIPNPIGEPVNISVTVSVVVAIEPVKVEV
jgi:hypothetical protein